MFKSFYNLTTASVLHSNRVTRFAGRYRLRKPQANTNRENYLSTGASDDKFVKLTKKEDDDKRMKREVLNSIHSKANRLQN